MNSFLRWLNDNNLQIVWFLIGFFIANAIDCFSTGNWSGMSLNLAFAALNYFINRRE
jgi:hypothetical protein